MSSGRARLGACGVVGDRQPGDMTAICGADVPTSPIMEVGKARHPDGPRRLTLPGPGGVQTDAVTDAQAAVPAAGNQDAARPDAQATPPRPAMGGNPDHPAAHSSGLYGLALGALGIVFGDIGTSPLYAVQTVFSIDDGAVQPTVADVYGVVSLIFWSITRRRVGQVRVVHPARRQRRRGRHHGARRARARGGGRHRPAGRRSRWPSACSGRRCSTATRSSRPRSRCCRPSRASRWRSRSWPTRSCRSVSSSWRCCSRRSASARTRWGGCSGPSWCVVRGAGRVGRAAHRRAPRRALGLVADLRRVVRRRPPLHGVHRDGRGRAGDHRRRGALRRHGPLRAPTRSGSRGSPSSSRP